MESLKALTFNLPLEIDEKVYLLGIQQTSKYFAVVVEKYPPNIHIQ